MAIDGANHESRPATVSVVFVVLSPIAVQAANGVVLPNLNGTQLEVGRTYTVVAGDSLSKIAKKLYGDGSKWKVIFAANRDILKNPDLIHPGPVLIIPDL